MPGAFCWFLLRTLEDAVATLSMSSTILLPNHSFIHCLAAYLCLASMVLLCSVFLSCLCLAPYARPPDMWKFLGTARTGWRGLGTQQVHSHEHC